MALFLVVSEGPDPESARPILACSEQRILRRVAEEITETLRGGAGRPARRGAWGADQREVRSREPRSGR